MLEILEKCGNIVKTHQKRLEFEPREEGKKEKLGFMLKLDLFVSLPGIYNCNPISNGFRNTIFAYSCH